MNILIIAPCLRPHGGTRSLIDMSSKLQDRGHHVVFHSLETGSEDDMKWANLKVFTTVGTNLYLLGYDVVICGSPVIANAIKDYPVKKFLFLQMAEELFKPGDTTWYTECMQAYYSGMPIITISHWLIYRLRSMGVNSVIHYIDLGVDEQFMNKNLDRSYILVANWNAQNPAKDVDALGPRVAQFLKKKYNVKVAAYGADPMQWYTDIPDLYVQGADTTDLVELYNRSLFTVQATKYDCRSYVGLESISCSTPVCRAIINGDDDILHLKNAVRCNYSIDELLFWADKMYSDHEFLEELRSGCKPFRWDIRILEKIISL